MFIKKLSVILLLVAILFSSCTIGETNPSEPVTPPNILFILVDDLDQLLGTMDYMPNLKKYLIKKGLTFTTCLVSDPECCPSRSTILRGQYVHSHQVFTNKPPSGSFNKFYERGLEESTVATWLQAKGYRTVLLGKYLNSYPNENDPTHVPPGWTEWYSLIMKKENLYYNYQLNENGKIVSYGDQAEDYQTDVLAKKAIDFIQRATEEQQPFFMYLAPYAPHDPATPAPRHTSLFTYLQAPRTPSFNEEDIFDKPQTLRKDKLRRAQIQEIDAKYRQRVQSMQAVDEMIAQLLNVLEEKDQLEKTYIIFTSDNGYHMGQHRFLSGKTRVYEEDIRVPLIIRGPDIPSGKKLDNYLVSNIDLAPTIAELAGARVPDFVEGRSLVALFSKNRPEPSEWRKALLIETYPSPSLSVGELKNLPPARFEERIGFITTHRPINRNSSEPAPVFISIRTERYKYVEYYDGGRELYDLEEDPYEMMNLFENFEPALLGQLAEWLHLLQDCSGGECRKLEDAPPTTGQT